MAFPRRHRFGHQAIPVYSLFDFICISGSSTLIPSWCFSTLISSTIISPASNFNLFFPLTLECPREFEGIRLVFENKLLVVVRRIVTYYLSSREYNFLVRNLDSTLTLRVSRMRSRCASFLYFMWKTANQCIRGIPWENPFEIAVTWASKGIMITNLHNFEPHMRLLLSAHWCMQLWEKTDFISIHDVEKLSALFLGGLFSPQHPPEAL